MMDALQCTVPMSYIVAQYRLQRQAFSNAFYGHPVYRTLQIYRPFEEAMLGSGIKLQMTDFSQARPRA
jgi:hypothetical protein